MKPRGSAAAGVVSPALGSEAGRGRLKARAAAASHAAASASSHAIAAATPQRRRGVPPARAGRAAARPPERLVHAARSPPARRHRRRIHVTSRLRALAAATAVGMLTPRAADGGRLLVFLGVRGQPFQEPERGEKVTVLCSE